MLDGQSSVLEEHSLAFWIYSTICFALYPNSAQKARLSTFPTEVLLCSGHFVKGLKKPRARLRKSGHRYIEAAATRLRVDGLSARCHRFVDRVIAALSPVFIIAPLVALTQRSTSPKADAGPMPGRRCRVFPSIYAGPGKNREDRS
jgi:hypothetical protein